jgi:hypothetical protein
MLCFGFRQQYLKCILYKLYYKLLQLEISEAIVVHFPIISLARSELSKCIDTDR